MEQSPESRWERPDAPLGTLVYRAGLLSKEKLESALVEGRRTGKRLGEVLLQKGWIDEKDLARLVAGQKGVAFVSLRGRGFDMAVAKSLDEQLCRGNDAVAVEDAGDHIVVALADPTDDDAVAEVKAALGREVEFVVATPSDIHEVLDEVFSGASNAPLTDFSLRLAQATPASDPDPAPPVIDLPVVEEPAVEVPVAEDPVVVETPVVEPDPVEPTVVPVAIELPKLPPTPQPDAEPTPEPVTRIEIVGIDPEPPAAGPAAEGQNDAELGIANPSEPTIERNEDAHVSLAFHSAPPEPETAEPEPDVAVPAAEIAPPPPTEVELGWRIVLNLVDEEELDVAFFATEAEAKAAARELVVGIAKDAEWPQVGRKFIPPERIESVEVRERARFGGSADRAAWDS